MVRGPEGHAGTRAQAVPGPSGGGMDVTQLYTGHNVRQTCTLLQCGVRWQGVCTSCTSVVNVRVVDRKAQWRGEVTMSFVL